MGDDPTYVYSPLDANVDSIRLVVLEPSKDPTRRIRCRIRHVAFREKPKYEALSYTWGDHPASEKILLDGAGFLVGPNLLQALQHLKDGEKERVLWVDAICINQTDIHEKNKQISIMPYIYTRAQCVLVWLGVPTYATMNDILRPAAASAGVHKSYLEQLWQLIFSGDSMISLEGIKLLEAMCNELYWTRLWIIQEISLARRVQVCYAGNTVEWKGFIQAVSKTPFGSSNANVPMKLDLQLTEKYWDGHKLQKLLENHQQALCKEPRDHVYGFVGLATDCIDGFPLDYHKSLFEVWKDTVMHRNADLKGSRYDVMKFSTLVRRLLGGPDIAGADEISQDLEVRMAVVPPRRHSIHFSARLVGAISFIGPTYDEIIADLKKTTEWKSSIHRHIPGPYLPIAMEESDMFLEILEGVEDKDLELVGSFDRETLWKAPELADVEPDVKVFRGDINWDEVEKHTPNLVNSHTLPNTSEDRRLFLVDISNRRYDSPGAMGLAPPTARVGDYVLEVLGIERGLIVREEGLKLTIVGTTVLAENKEKGRATRKSHPEGGIKFGVPDFEFQGGDGVEIVLDVAIAYHLLVR